MFKNTASQKLTVFAFDASTNLPKTGDAANLTAYCDLDDGGVTVLTDTSATEKDSTNAKGYYIFDLSQAETNGDKILFSCKSSTSNVVVIAVPAVVYTTPPAFSALTKAAIAATTWDELLTGATHNITSSAGKLLRLVVPVTTALRTGTAQGGSSTTITLDSGASAVNDFYVPSIVSITSGTGAGQSAIALSYVGATKVLTITDTFATPPDNTSVFSIDAFGQVVVAGFTAGAIKTTSFAAGAIDATAFAQGAADKVWSTSTRLLTAGTNIVLAKGTGVTGFNDIAATAIVSSGAITTSGGAVSAVTTTTNLTNLPSIPTNWLTAAGLATDAAAEIAVAVRDVDNTSPAASSLGAAVNTAAAGGGGLDAAGTRAALGMASANMDTQLATLSTFDVSSDSVKLDLTQVIGGTATLADALKAAYAQGAGEWDLNTSTKVLTLKNKDGTTFIQFDIDSVTSPTYRHIH